MTSPPSPPKRLRRRIVVAAAVLVLVLGWWFWPAKIDPRLVGKWEVWKYHDVTEGIRYAGMVPTIDFRTNGTAVLAIEGVSETFPFHWSAESNRVRFGYREPSPNTFANDLYSAAMRWIYRAVDPYLFDAEYDIVSMNDMCVFLHERGTRNIVQLTRGPSEVSVEEFGAISKYVRDKVR